MNVISLDLFLLVAGLTVTIYFRFFKENYKFQAVCQLIGTFWAQYSYGVSFSLGRIVPFISGTRLRGDRGDVLRSFVPFVVYSVITTLIFSFFWKIPSGIQTFYGELRVLIQLAVFTSIVLNTLGLGKTITLPNAPLYLRNILSLAAAIHGLASVYQLVATEVGLPVIGISRAHLQDLDVGIFESGESLVYRVGGLAGEPKTVAVIFGIHLLCMIFVPAPESWTRHRLLLEYATGLLSASCFVLSYSTSAYVAIIVAILILTWRFRNEAGLRFLKIAVFSLAVVLIVLIFLGNMGNFSDVLGYMRLRTVDRFFSGEVDPPVAASIELLQDDSRTLFLGTGMGGSSFSIMRYMGAPWDLSYAANIGIILLLVESGVIGTLLLLWPCWKLYRIKLPVNGHQHYWDCRFLLCIGVATLIFQLLGSGIYLGYPLAIGCMAGSYELAGRTPATGNPSEVLRVAERDSKGLDA